MPAGLSIFIISFVAAIIVRFIELISGIDHGFHPDSIHYIEYYHIFTANSIFSTSIFNNGYYYIVSIFDGDIEYLILFNQIIFSLTNVIIFKIFGTEIRKLHFFHYFILFLPYRFHLSAHVLKDTIIIFLLVSTYFSTLRTLSFGFIAITVFRISVAPIILLLRAIPQNRSYLLIFIISLLTIIITVPEISNFLADRSEVDMGGRDYFIIPLADASGFQELLGKIILWPFLAKTGIFSAVSPHPVTFAIAIEPLIFTTWTVMKRKSLRYLFEDGVIAMIFIALLVNSFGAYYRYVYPFLIIDYILQTKKLQDNKLHPSNR